MKSLTMPNFGYYCAGFIILCSICIAPVSGSKVSGIEIYEQCLTRDTVVHSMTVSSLPNDLPMDMQVDVGGFGQTVQKN